MPVGDVEWAEACVGLELKGEIQVRGERFGNHQFRSFSRSWEESMRLFRRDKDLADPG